MMNNRKSEVSFVQPMPFSLKKVKTLIKKINDCCQTLPASLNTMNIIVGQWVTKIEPVKIAVFLLF